MSKIFKQGQNNKSIHVLIAEDDAFIARVYIKFLNRKGIQVTHVHNGAEVLKCLSVADVDLLLLDLAMPGMNGYETLLQLRKIPKFARLPVIILSNTTLDTQHEWYTDINGADIVGIYRKFETSLNDLFHMIINATELARSR